MITLDHGLIKFIPIKNPKTMWKLNLTKKLCNQFCIIPKYQWTMINQPWVFIATIKYGKQFKPVLK